VSSPSTSRLPPNYDRLHAEARADSITTFFPASA
jgi:hypothetical protein